MEINIWKPDVESEWGNVDACYRSMRHNWTSMSGSPLAGVDPSVSVGNTKYLFKFQVHNDELPSLVRRNARHSVDADE